MKLKAVEFDGSNHRKVVTETGKEIGLFYLDCDGSYYFESGLGMHSSYNLRQIADLLDEINKPFEQETIEFFKNIENKEEITDFTIDEFTGIIYPKE